MLEENTHAPDFELLDQDEKVHTLSSFLGSWLVLYFYPKDDTSGCTKEACAFRDNLKNFEKRKITVVGVSGDSVDSHLKFRKKYGLPFTLLSDPDKKVIKDYGAKGAVGTKRISYLIDPDGNIKRAYPKVSPAEHAEQILKDLDQILSVK